METVLEVEKSTR